MSLGKAAWLTTTLGCVLAGILLVVSSYQGYGAVLFAVGLSAAINLR